jgi:branched-chain amino acid transport system substrate-binding protein
VRSFNALAVAALVALTTLPAAGQPAEPYEVPAVLSLTGQLAFASHSIQQSLTLIEKVVNASGGIHGRPLHVTFLDDGSNAATTVALVSQQIAKKVPLVFGPSFVPGCQATLPLIAKDGPVSLCYSPLIRPARGAYMFAASVNVQDQARGFLRYFHDRGWSRLALLMSTDAQGQIAERTYDALLGLRENAAFAVVARDHFNAGDLSLEAQIQHARSANPDVLITTVTGPPLGTVLRALYDAGLNVPVAASFGNMTYVQMEQYKTFLPKTLLFPGLRAMTKPLAPPGPIRDAQQRYFDAYASIGVRPDNGNAVSWDLTLAAIDTVRRLGAQATAPQIRDALENLHGWVGINGVYDFGDAEHRGIGVDAMVVDGWDAARNDFVAVSRPGGRLR